MKIKDFFRNNWPQIVLVFIVSVVGVINFVPGKYLLSNDNYSPELNPSLTIERSLLSPAWRSYRGLGVPSDSEQADIIRAGLFSLGEDILGGGNLKQIYNISMLLIGSFFAGLLAKALVNVRPLRSESSEIVSNIAFLTSGLFYLSSLWTVWLYYQNIAPYISNFGVFPMVLYFTFKYIHTPSFKSLLLLLISSLLLSSVAVISTLFIVDLVFYILFLLFFIFYVGANNFLKSALSFLRTLGIFISVHLFWILPLFFYTLSTQEFITDSYVNRAITSSVIDLERGTQTLDNTVRFYTRALSETSESFLYFPSAENYLKLDLFKIVSYLPLFFSLLAFIFALYLKNLKIVALSIILIFSIVLINVDNPPFGGIFTWLQESVPLFKQVFRWPSSKVNGMLLLSMSVLGGISFGYFSSLFRVGMKKGIWNKVLISSLLFFFISIQLLFSGYLFRGELFPERAMVNIPSEYFELGEYLEENNPTSRIYYFPPSNNNYFREYDWGFYGSQFISYIVPNPILDLSHAVGSKESEDLMLELANIIRANDSESFNTILNQYDIEYLLVDRSINPSGFTFSIDMSKSSSLLNGFELEWEKGYIELYRVPYSSNSNSAFVEASSNYGQTNGNYFTRVAPKSPTISPLGLLFDDVIYENNFLVGKLIYSGKSFDYTFEIPNSDIHNYPTSFKLVGSSIIAQPAIPTIEGSTNDGANIVFGGSEVYEQYSVNGEVVTRSELLNGVSTRKTFTSNHIIKGVESAPKYTFDALPQLTKSSAEDCSGGVNTYDIKVEDLTPATGFTINSSSPLPCVYSALPIQSAKDFTLKVKLNWESAINNFAGFCLFSTLEEKCLNQDKFFASSGTFDEIDLIIPKLVSKNDTVSLILYSLNSEATENPIIFRKADLSVFEATGEFSIISQDTTPFRSTVTLASGNEYLIKVPVINGSNSYIYSPSNSEVTSIWQPSGLQSYSSLGWNNGMKQIVQNGFVNQSNTLFKPNPLLKYLVYFEGENINNIPASICISYIGQDKCWYQNMLFADQKKSIVDTFVSSQSLTTELNVIYSSHSYKSKSENVLNNLIVMELPEVWQNISYKPESSIDISEYSIIEMSRKGKSPHSTNYIYNNLGGKANEYTIVSIPQAQSSGWFAVAKTNDGLMVLGNEYKVTINGWKQGWDISNTDFTQINVIFWPNLLAYYGYLVILLEFVIVFWLLFFSKKKHAKQ